MHVSPPQKSNELVWQWWRRHQPVDHGTIAGPLCTEAEFKEMNEVPDANDIQIVVDTVFNHTVDVTEQPDPPFIELGGDVVSEERFPQFEPEHFHQRCLRRRTSRPDGSRTIWPTNAKVRRGWLMHERPTGELAHWDVPGAKRDDVVRIDG